MSPKLRYFGLSSCALALLLAGWGSVRADIEATLPDGRQVILKDDGTWRFAESAKAADPAASAASAADSGVPATPAELEVLSKRDVPGGCQYELQLSNRLGYQIRNLVPDIRIVRRGGTAYADQAVGFSRVLPGDQQLRSLRVRGLACAEIEKLQLTGGDRCEMDQLNKFTEGKGLCLARIAVKPGEVVTLEK